jgi:hypothetical protein
MVSFGVYQLVDSLMALRWYISPVPSTLREPFRHRGSAQFQPLGECVIRNVEADVIAKLLQKYVVVGMGCCQ